MPVSELKFDLLLGEGCRVFNSDKISIFCMYFTLGRIDKIATQL